MKYAAFDRFVIRVPAIPVSSYLSALENKDLFTEAVSSGQFAESIMLTSDNLYSEYRRYLSGMLSDKDTQRMSLTLNKYLSRMAMRCTPFGAFARLGVGTWDEECSLSLSEDSPIVRPDTTVLYAIFRKLLNRPATRRILRYSLNTTLIRCGRKFRYYRYSEHNGRRSYYIQAVDFNPVVATLMKRCSHPLPYQELIRIITESVETDPDEAARFIDNLIDEQLLISEIEPDALTSDYFEQLNQICNESDSSLDKMLHSTAEGLKKIRESRSSLQRMDIYTRISSDLRNYAPDLKVKLQCDCFLRSTSLTLPANLPEKIGKLFDPIARISHRWQHGGIAGFRSRYLKRYEEQSVPLSVALDPVTGIGYGNTSSGISNPLMGGIKFARRTGSGHPSDSLTFTQTDHILHKKIMADPSAHIIRLNDEDISALPLPDDAQLPETLSAFFSIVHDYEGNELIDSLRFNGASAASLIGRFAYGSKAVHSLLKDICRADSFPEDPDIIHAEISHLPSSHIGNIMTRPNVRGASVCLATFNNGDPLSIPVSDLWIRIKAGNLELWSERMGRQIIPHMSSAHNYSLDTIPAYRFLCDFASQNKQTGYSFSWGPLSRLFTHRPRVIYHDVILSRESWDLTFPPSKGKSSAKVLPEDFMKLCTANSMPRFVQLVSGDNELFVDTFNTFSITTLCSELKNGCTYTFQEFLEGSLNDTFTGASYQNEIILPFKLNRRS